MPGQKILIIEDEEDILELIRYNLEKEGFQAVCAAEGGKGLHLAQAETPDLILLDLMLPEVSGHEICKRLKADSGTRDIPIIMVTAKGEESDIVKGLESGADDYITKPFSPRVLIARVKTVLRRRGDSASEGNVQGSNNSLRVGELDIHPGRHEVRAGGSLVELTYSEFSTLYLLARRPGWVYTRQQIVEGIRGEEYPVTDRSIDVIIVGLRKKLGIYGRHISTVRGVGYRFQH